MSTVQIFTDYESMVKAVQANREHADAQVTDWQTTLQPGDHFYYESHGLPIVGVILPPGGKTEAELAVMDPEDAAELREEASTYAMPHMKNYRFTRSYSEVCPDGELGDIHVSSVRRKITEAEFNELLADFRKLAETL